MMVALCMTFRTERLRFAILTFFANNRVSMIWDVCGGSSRFQSPEEYQLGSDIDEITNVYTLGATAFALFGEYNRTRDKWQLSDKLFEIATRAVSDDRAHRQQTIRQFKAEWEAAQ